MSTEQGSYCRESKSDNGHLPSGHHLRYQPSEMLQAADGRPTPGAVLVGIRKDPLLNSRDGPDIGSHSLRLSLDCGKGI